MFPAFIARLVWHGSTMLSSVAIKLQLLEFFCNVPILMGDPECSVIDVNVPGKCTQKVLAQKTTFSVAYIVVSGSLNKSLSYC